MRGHRDPDCNIDLGLAILKRRTQWMIEERYPSELIAQFRTLEAMAFYSNCSREGIRQIYEKAMRKLRVALMFRQPWLWLELREILESMDCNGRKPAQRNGQAKHYHIRA